MCIINVRKAKKKYCEEVKSTDVLMYAAPTTASAPTQAKQTKKCSQKTQYLQYNMYCIMAHVLKLQQLVSSTSENSQNLHFTYEYIRSFTSIYLYVYCVWLIIVPFVLCKIVTKLHKKMYFFSYLFSICVRFNLKSSNLISCYVMVLDVVHFFAEFSFFFN